MSSLEELKERKRKNPPILTPSVDDYFMGCLFFQAAACQDPVVQHAAQIVDSKKQPVSFGYNNMPPDAASNRPFAWDVKGRELAMMTAEEAAIDRALRRYVVETSSVTAYEVFSRHVMYLTGPPSLRGVRRCVEVSLKSIIYGPQFYEDPRNFQDAKELAEAYNISIKPFEGNISWVRDRVDWLKDRFGGKGNFF